MLPPTPTRVSPFAKLLFLVPAVLLAAGGLVLSDLPAWCDVGHPCGWKTNTTCDSSQACSYPFLGIALLAMGLISVPISVVAYRSRRYTPLP